MALTSWAGLPGPVPVAGSVCDRLNASGVSLGPPIGSPTGTEMGSEAPLSRVRSMS